MCDGKWDCPNGIDENLFQCGKYRVCSHMFRCRDSQICILMENICDSINDCPVGDDEIMCELLKVRCPQHCKCLNLAVMCKKMISKEIFMIKLPYLSYHVTDSEINDAYPFMLNVNLVILNLTKNYVSYIVRAIPNLNSYRFLMYQSITSKDLQEMLF